VVTVDRHMAECFLMPEKPSVDNQCRDLLCSNFLCAILFFLGGLDGGLYISLSFDGSKTDYL